jgi:hypothetical protein
MAREVPREAVGEHCTVTNTLDMRSVRLPVSNQVHTVEMYVANVRVGAQALSTVGMVSYDSARSLMVVRLVTPVGRTGVGSGDPAEGADLVLRIEATLGIVNAGLSDYREGTIGEWAW